MNKMEYESRIWEIGTLIKLVAVNDINSICSIATTLRNTFEPEDIDLIDNKTIYDAYCGGSNI